MPRKTVAIRGLDTDLYNEVFYMAKKDGKRVSDVVNIALQAYIKGDYEAPAGSDKMGSTYVLTLEDDGAIALSSSDIKSIGEEMGPFIIESAGHLTFEKDVDKNTLKYIERIIIRSGTVRAPKKTYAQFLLKSKIQGKLEKY